MCYCWLFSCGHHLLMLVSFWQCKFMELAGVFCELFISSKINIKDCALQFWGQ